MKGILVVAHGSRAKETETTLDVVLGMVKAKLPDSIIEHAYMEFGDKTISAAIEILDKKGVTEMKVVPYFLFEGIHIREDIPNMINKCMASKPHISYTIGNSLGTDPRLGEILLDRIKE